MATMNLVLHLTAVDLVETRAKTGIEDDSSLKMR